MAGAPAIETIATAGRGTSTMSRRVEVRRSKLDDFLAIEELIAQADAVATVEGRFGKQSLTELLYVWPRRDVRTRVAKRLISHYLFSISRLQRHVALLHFRRWREWRGECASSTSTCVLIVCLFAASRL